MFWDSASAFCMSPQSSFIEHGKVQSSSVADGLSNSIHWDLSLSYQETQLYTLLSMLTFHSWYPHLFSLSLDGRDGELRCPFQAKHVFFFFSICECWLQQIYLAEFYMFSKFLCCTPNVVTTTCWKNAKLFSKCLLAFSSMIAIF